MHTRKKVHDKNGDFTDHPIKKLKKIDILIQLNITVRNYPQVIPFINLKKKRNQWH